MDADRSPIANWSTTAGGGWNQFWYAPSDAFPLALLRVFAGLAALYFLISYTPDLARWFGPDGLLPAETAREINKALYEIESDLPPMRPSYLYFFESPVMLWSTHLLAVLSVTAFTLGCFTRLTSVLAFVFVLCYINRAPMLTGPFEPVLSAILFYLCFAPCGRFISLDRWRRERSKLKAGDDAPSVAATVSLHLIQIHVSLFYLFMGLAQFASGTWRDGGAVWWLITRTESRLVDLTFLHRTPELIHLWTQGIILFELAFAILIWNRLMRPLLIMLSIPMWISLGLITGLVSFSYIMLIANVAFISADWLRAGWDWGAARLPFGRQAESLRGDAKAGAEKAAV